MILDGENLDRALKAQGIKLADDEINEVLSILNNHGKCSEANFNKTFTPCFVPDESIDIYDFCYLINTAAKYIGQLKSKLAKLAALIPSR